MDLTLERVCKSTDWLKNFFLFIDNKTNLVSEVIDDLI